MRWLSCDRPVSTFHGRFGRPCRMRHGERASVQGSCRSRIWSPARYPARPPAIRELPQSSWLVKSGRPRRAEPSSAGTVRLSPAVSEGGVVPDLLELGVTVAELIANPLDRRSDVRPIPGTSPTSDESLVVQTIVDRAIGHVATGIGREQMDDFEFTEREVEIYSIPRGSPVLGSEDKLAKDQGRCKREKGLHSARFGNASETFGKYLHAARLEDKVECAFVESQTFMGLQIMTGEEYDRQANAIPAQSGQQVDAGHLRQNPIEYDDIGIDGGVERAE